ncbi:TPA: mevalonate kinase [Candidatus Bathyarchaeota archaeon]|nr:mevalonate kinase [Candidatus Bathyarchaeota archaeon]
MLGLNLTKEKIFQLAYESERVIHGTPSGIDPAISTYGGVVLYRRNEGVRPLQVKTDIPIVVGETGFERSTGDMVAKVRKLRDTYPSLIDPIIRIGGLIVKEALHALEEGDLKVLGDLMNIDHGLLSAVGVSSCTIEKLVYMARQAGALGAKLTGAGGGGCIIALTEKDNIWKVKKAMQNAGWKAFAASRAREGVRIESNYT